MFTADILILAKRRDRDALDILCKHFLSAISAYIAAHAPPYAVDDLTSDVFVKMVEGIHEVRANDEQSFRSWLFRVAENTITDYHRRRKHTEPLSLELQAQLRAADDHDPLRALTDQETIEDLAKSLDSLTEEQRHVLDGRFVHGLSFDAIAQQMGKQAGTVRALQHRALQSLRRNLGRIIVILFLLGALLGIAYALIRTASPGSPLYPARQWPKHLHHSLRRPGPHPATRATPTHAEQATPMATTTAVKTADDLESTDKQGSSTPTPTATATSTPVPIPSATATVLPTATTATTTVDAHVCLLAACVDASLP